MVERENLPFYKHIYTLLLIRVHLTATRLLSPHQDLNFDTLD